MWGIPMTMVGIQTSIVLDHIKGAATSCDQAWIPQMTIPSDLLIIAPWLELALDGAGTGKPCKANPRGHHRWLPSDLPSASPGSVLNCLSVLQPLVGGYVDSNELAAQSDG